MNEAGALAIIQDTIKYRFPAINTRRTRVIFVRKKDYYMAVSFAPFSYRIMVDGTILRFSEIAFKGCLAHELCHILMVQRLSAFKRIKYFLFSGETEDEERLVDTMAVEMGFGPELLRFHEEHNKIYKPYKAKEGLTKG